MNLGNKPKRQRAWGTRPHPSAHHIVKIIEIIMGASTHTGTGTGSRRPGDEAITDLQAPTHRHTHRHTHTQAQAAVAQAMKRSPTCKLPPEGGQSVLREQLRGVVVVHIPVANVTSIKCVKCVTIEQAGGARGPAEGVLGGHGRKVAVGCSVGLVLGDELTSHE